MSGSPQYEEDVFIEDDLEEDEYLYQVAINFGDSKSEAIESLEYEDDSEEEGKPGSTKKKASLPHNPRSESANAVKMSDEPIPSIPPVTVITQSTTLHGSDPENIDEAADGQTGVVPESILDYAKVWLAVFICLPLKISFTLLLLTCTVFVF